MHLFPNTERIHRNENNPVKLSQHTASKTLIRREDLVEIPWLFNAVIFLNRRRSSSNQS